MCVAATKLVADQRVFTDDRLAIHFRLSVLYFAFAERLTGAVCGPRALLCLDDSQTFPLLPLISQRAICILDDRGWRRRRDLRLQRCDRVAVEQKSRVKVILLVYDAAL